MMMRYETSSGEISTIGHIAILSFGAAPTSGGNLERHGTERRQPRQKFADWGGGPSRRGPYLYNGGPSMIVEAAMRV